VSGDRQADRRSVHNVALRAAFDELALAVSRAYGERESEETLRGASKANAAYLAVSACARQARTHGVPPERFLVALKRFLERHPKLQHDLDELVAMGTRIDPREQLVTWAIAAYFRAPSAQAG
jgi:hypothetical protein